MQKNFSKPLIIQSDFLILLETKSVGFQLVRDKVSSFLEVIKSQQVFYVYKLSEVSLWNGFSMGISNEKINEILAENAKFPVPQIITDFINDNYERYGKIKLIPYNKELHEIAVEDDFFFQIIDKIKILKKYLIIKDDRYFIPYDYRGVLKADMANYNFPIDDCIPPKRGLPILLNWNKDIAIRDYQEDAVNSFLGNEKEEKSDSGIIVLPCGAGKTIVGIETIRRLKTSTLVVTPNIVSLRQWRKEIIEKTDFDENQVLEYSGEKKEIGLITVITYQILSSKKKESQRFKHLTHLNKHDWGLIIYDEVHVLPAPIFKIISSLQSFRALGLTATLVREDNKEKDIFSLIGSKKFDLPWKILEENFFIAAVKCYEIKIPLIEHSQQDYYQGNFRDKFRIAAENKNKIRVIQKLLNIFKDQKIIIIGQYINQLETISKELDLALITGKDSNERREHYYNAFNKNEISTLIVSKIANFAVDLPDANVAIQVSGSYGSRQEEAQRVGRIIRPKKGNNTSYFFSLVTMDTQEEKFVFNRRGFLLEQGYSYQEMYENGMEEFENSVSSF